MKLKLTPSDRMVLREIQLSEDKKRVYVRVTIVLMLDMDFSPSQICAALGVSESRVSRSKKQFLELGLDDYLTDKYVPYSGKLSEIQREELKVHLTGNCYANARSICDWILGEYGIEYTSTGLVPLLGKLGFSYKKTKPVPAKADAGKQEDFLDMLDILMEEAESGESEVYFSDACHPMHGVRPSYGWIRTGTEFEIKTNSGRRRININGLLNARNPMRILVDFPERVNAQSTRHLYEKLLRKHKGKTIYVICDNARYYRNRELGAWLSDKRIVQVFLPPYSPNLNLIERLWKFLKTKIINSTFYEKFEDFEKGIKDFFVNIKKYKSELKSLMTLNFNIMDSGEANLQTT